MTKKIARLGRAAQERFIALLEATKEGRISRQAAARMMDLTEWEVHRLATLAWNRRNPKRRPIKYHRQGQEFELLDHGQSEPARGPGNQEQPAMTDSFRAEGGCACGDIRYRIEARPMFVNGCHCTLCQRQTGTAFATNAMIERRFVALLAGTPETVTVPSASGRGQTILRCPRCWIALWSHYGGAGDNIAFLRCGTLDQPASLAPDAHIFVSTKQSWLPLPEGVPSYPGFYDPKEAWPPETMARFMAARQG